MSVMDEADRQRLLATLRSDDAFRATVRRELLTDALLDLPQIVAEMQHQFAKMQGQMVEMQRHLVSLDASVAALIEHQAEMQRQIVELQLQMTEIRGEVRFLVETARKLFETTVEGFRDIGHELAQHKADTAAGFTAVAARFDQLDGAVADIRDRLAS